MSAMSKGDSYYLSLLTDAYSRKIVGWAPGGFPGDVRSDKSVNMALETLPPGSDLIHHSDRGVQYVAKIISQFYKALNVV
ncbi:hypothetical protein PARMER_01106 [Parabacteroides merdae ATCC 43184]|nr:hypothetical protein PARMER_01106 [Parabacteroides merdae ATCC 43184]